MLVPWLAGWSYAELDPELRKSFEVVLHGATAAALLVALREEVAEATFNLDRRRVALIALSLAPPALLGLACERTIERHLGTPLTTAVGLIGGSAAMALADARASGRRPRAEAGARDGLWLGVAQACALIPGVSRNGATLAAARARGFGRADANALSRHVALPVIVAATALKGMRLGRRLRRDWDGALALALAAGGASAVCSAAACTRIIRQVERERSLAPYATYRLALAGIVIRRVRQNART
jgi:undecaprenyl-diphosphatase